MQKQSGFTILELMITIGIMAILASIAIPGVIGWLPRYHLGSAARDILAVVEDARQEAVQRNTSIGISFNTAGDSYTIWIDSVPGGSANDNDATLNGAESALSSGQMPVGIDMTAAAFGADPRFRFNGMGIPTRTDGLPGGGAVTVTNRNGDSRTVTVTRGGNSSIQ
jgi:type IV fimbrial biogenesis protein FimT